MSRKPNTVGGSMRALSGASGIVALALILSAGAGTADWISTAAPGKRIGVIGLDTSHAPAFAQASTIPTLLSRDSPIAVSLPRIRRGARTSNPAQLSRAGYTERFQTSGSRSSSRFAALARKRSTASFSTPTTAGRIWNRSCRSSKRASPASSTSRSPRRCDAVAIFEAAGRSTRFPSSPRRLSAGSAEGAQELRGGSPRCTSTAATPSARSSLERPTPISSGTASTASRPLFTVMGTGCESVTVPRRPGHQRDVGIWTDGRIGTFRGSAGERGYGGTAFAEKKNVMPARSGGYGRW